MHNEAALNRFCLHQIDLSKLRHALIVSQIDYLLDRIQLTRVRHPNKFPIVKATASEFSEIHRERHIGSVLFNPILSESRFVPRYDVVAAILVENIAL